MRLSALYAVNVYLEPFFFFNDTSDNMHCNKHTASHCLGCISKIPLEMSEMFIHKVVSFSQRLLNKLNIYIL